MNIFHRLFYFFLSGGGGYVDRKHPDESKALFPLSALFLLPLILFLVTLRELELIAPTNKVLSNISILVTVLMVWFANQYYFFSARRRRWKKIADHYEKLSEEALSREMKHVQVIVYCYFMLYLFIAAFLVFHFSKT